MSKSLLSTSQKLLEQSLTDVGDDAITQVLPTILAEINEASSVRVYKQDIKAFVAWLHEV